MKINNLFKKSVSAVVCAAAVGFVATASAHGGLTVVSWGGAYTKSQMLAYVMPFREATGLGVDVLDYNGGLAQIRAQVESYNVRWDVVDLLLSDAIRGCNEGLLEKIDPSSLAPAPDGTPAAQDFLDGTLRDCAVGTLLWSTVIAYNGDRYADNPPKTLNDFFDVKKFPGPRGLQRTPRVNLEWALLADGVPKDQVYAVLSTSQGIDRAFKKLGTIKPYVVLWWETGDQPARALADGEVVMTSTWNGRVYAAAAEKNKPLTVLWDGQVWDIDLWGIPKGSQNLETALEFIKFSTDTQRLADQAKYIAYGPARKSSMALVSETVKPQLPTAAENMQNALEFNAKWWAENEDRLRERFEQWLELPSVIPADLAR